jgi:eukaryotic-like serine/threonine-protein kinase
MPRPLQPSELIQRFRVDRLLGEGAMGSVYRAIDTGNERPVALKIMSAEAARQHSARRRFLREARAAAAVDHPNVVRILEVFEHQDQPIMAMEFLDGESFEDYIASRGGKVPLRELSRIMIRVTSAVGTAHALGIVHRDLKPLNIFITKGDVLGVKVLDFGIAKLTSMHGLAAQTEALTQTGAIMGTPFYMAPEQAMGERDVDHRADIWSLGIILYRCITGTIPTEGTSFGDIFRKVVLAEFDPIEARAPQTPRELAEIVHRMLSRDRDERPWDLREVHTALERMAEEKSPAFEVAVRPALEDPDGDAGVDEAPRKSEASDAPRTRGPLALRPGGLVRPEGARDPGDSPRSEPDPQTEIVTPLTSRSLWLPLALLGFVLAAVAAWINLR